MTNKTLFIENMERGTLQGSSRNTFPSAAPISSFDFASNGQDLEFLANTKKVGPLLRMCVRETLHELRIKQLNYPSIFVNLKYEIVSSIINVCIDKGMKDILLEK